MDKTIKIVIKIVLGIVIGYLIYFFYGVIKYSHSADWHIYKQYMWIFKDSIRKDIDTNFCFSYVQKHDVYNYFSYKGNTRIVVWEFKDLKKANLKEIALDRKGNLNDVKFVSGEILNKGSDIEITVKKGFAFNSAMKVNVDEYSSIVRNFEGNKYKGFYGSINKMSFSNEKNEHQIFLNFTKGQTPTLFLIYNGHQSFFLIMINAEKTFDESILDVLNLD